MHFFEADNLSLTDQDKTGGSFLETLCTLQQQKNTAKRLQFVSNLCILMKNVKFPGLYLQAVLRIRIRSFLVTRIRIWIRENTGSGSRSFIHKKTPVIQIFLLLKFVKNHFRPNNFLFFILSVI